MQEKVAYVDTPDRKQKYPHYEHRTNKLDLKDNDFTSKKFQHIRKYSTRKKINDSFKRIGMCLNNKPTSTIPTSDLDNVCFILINDYKTENNNLGVGPLNDGYLIGLNHHRLGYKILYLYNCPSDQFLTDLEFIMLNTKKHLTVFYSGRDDKIMDGIEFNDGTLSRKDIHEVISSNCNDKRQVMLISDTPCGGSVFDITGCSNIVSFSVRKTENDKSKDFEKTHGIFTYYFCKITKEKPNITPNQLAGRINTSLSRFCEELTLDTNDENVCEKPIFN